MPLHYEDQVPTVPGWYWVRKNDSVRIIEFPHCGTWPRPWQQVRDEKFAAAPDNIRAALISLPEDTWKVEYAGPIDEPVN
jgi:hypothetical protein